MPMDALLEGGLVVVLLGETGNGDNRATGGKRRDMRFDSCQNSKILVTPCSLVHLSSLFTNSIYFPFRTPKTSPAVPSAQPTASFHQIQSPSHPYSGYPRPNTHTGSHPTPSSHPAKLALRQILQQLLCFFELPPTPAGGGDRVPFRGRGEMMDWRMEVF